MRKYLSILFLFFFIWHPELKASGPEPWYGGNTTQLPPCLEDHKEDIEYIRQYLSVSKNDKAKRAELIQKMKSNDSFMGFFSQAITEKKKTGNETKTYKELLSNTDWIKLAEKTCNEIYQVAGEHYIKTIVSDLVSSECASRAAQKAINRFNPLKLYSYGTATLAAITEAWLCATEQDKCKGKDYWTQYSYGVLHAVIEQADLLAMSDVLKELFQSQYQSRMSCLGKESDIKIRAVQETETEETIHQALKCVLGIDVTVTELEQRYALTKSYIEKNWQEPYFRGEATVLISTLIVPTAKGVSLVRKGILAKFKKAATFSKEIQTLEALGAAEGKVDEIANVLKVSKNGEKLWIQIDETIGSFNGHNSATYYDVKVTYQTLRERVGVAFKENDILEFHLNIPTKLQQQNLGTEIFKQALIDYSPHKVKGWWKASDIYTGGESINLKIFKEQIAVGKTPIEAAFETPTGKILKMNGFGGIPEIIKNTSDEVIIYFNP